MAARGGDVAASVIPCGQGRRMREGAPCAPPFPALNAPGAGTAGAARTGRACVDDLLLGVAHQIVVLATFGEMHLGTEVAAILQVQAAHAGTREGRREVAAHQHLVEEPMLLAMTDLQAQRGVARVELGVHRQAFLAEHLGNLADRRAHHVVHEAVHLVPRGEVHGLRQASLPAAGALAVAAHQRRQGVAPRPLALRLHVEGLVQAPHHQ